MAIIVNCACGAKLRADDSDAGKRTRCPKCGSPLVVATSSYDEPMNFAPVPQAMPPSVFVPNQPYSQPPALQPQPYYPLSQRQYRTPPLSIAIMIVFGVLGILLILWGFASVSASNSYNYDRFKDDNAYGAAANALERLLRIAREPRPEGVFVCAFLCFVIVAVERLRVTIASK